MFASSWWQAYHVDDCQLTQRAQGIDAIPAKFRKKLDNVAIIVEDEPSRQQMEDNGLGSNETLLGLYEGIPQTKRGEGYGMVLPDKITIFQKQIEDAAHTLEEIPDIVQDTVWHEIAHHFGFNEHEVRERERERDERRKGR